MLTFPITLFGTSIVIPQWLTVAGVVVNAVEGDTPSVQLNVKKALSTDTLTFSIVGTNPLTAIGLSLSAGGLITGTVATLSTSTVSVALTVHVVDELGLSPPDRTFSISLTKLVVGVMLGTNMARWQTFAADPSISGNLFDFGSKVTSLGAITKFNGTYYAGYGGAGVNLLSSVGDNYWRYATTVGVPAGTPNVVVGMVTNGAAATNPVMVLVGRNGSTNYIMYSLDGLTWNQAATTNASPYKRVYAFGSLFVVITATSIETSTNGNTWTNITPSTSDVFTDVACDPATGRMIAVTSNATAGVWRATNPAAAGDWTQVTVVSPAAVTNSCGYSATTGLFYKCSTTSGKLMSSPDMTTWTVTSFGLLGSGQPNRMWTVDNNGVALAYFNNTLCFLGSDGGTSTAAPLATSIVGTTTSRAAVLDFYNDSSGVWFSANGAATSSIISHFAGGTSATLDFVAYSQSVATVTQTRVIYTPNVGWILLPWTMYSPDGIRWTFLNNLLLSTMINVALSQTSGLWIGIVPSGSGPFSYTSNDLVTWTAKNSGTLASGSPNDYSLKPNGALGFIGGPYSTFVVSSTGTVSNSSTGNHGDGNNAKVFATNTNMILFGAVGLITRTTDGNSFSGVTVGVIVNSLTRVGTIATVVTAWPHSYSTGATATITGAVPTGYNGAHAITVINTTTYTYTVSSSLATPATGPIASTLGVAPAGSMLGVGYDRTANLVASGTQRVVSVDNGTTWMLSASSLAAVSDVFYSATLGRFFELGNTATTTVTTPAGTVQSLGLGVTNVAVIKGAAR